MKRRFLLVFGMILMTGNLFAADRGLCGENIAWLFKDGVLTISGTGGMYQFDTYDQRPSYEEHKDKITKVVFDGDIEFVGPFAFDGYSSLAEIQFNEGLKMIMEGSFRGCSALKSLEFPASLEMLTVFYNDKDKDLRPDYINGSAERDFIFDWHDDRQDRLKMENAKGSFANCTSLETVTIGENVKRIGCATFAGCENLKTLYWNAIDCGMPRGIKQTSWFGYDYDMDTYVFAFCPINTVVFGEKVRRIPRKAFQNKGTLKDVRTNGNIEYVGGAAFAGTGWAASQPKDEMWYIDKVAYQYVPGKEVKGVKHVVRIRDNVSSISQLAFGSYNVLYSQDKPGCDPISELEFPASVGSVADQLLYQFQGDKDGCVVKWNIVDPVFTEEKVWDMRGGASVENENIPGKRLDFCEAANISEFIIGEGVRVIPSRMFCDGKYIKKITLPSTIEKIGPEAFVRSGAAIAGIPPHVKSIGHYAFSGINMEEVVIPNSTEYLGEWALPRSCRRLEIGENVKSDTPIRAIDFQNLTDLVWNAVDITPADGFKSLNPRPKSEKPTGPLNVAFGDKVKVIPAYTFLEADFPISISGGASVATIGEKAFYQAKGVSKIDLSETLTTIGESAFTEADLADVLIPASVKTMSADAFENCPMEYAICAASVPPVEAAKIGFYMNSVIAPKLYVPDTEAYSSWQPAPLPMLRHMDYFNGDGLTGEMRLKSNIPGYTATTTHKFTTLEPGDHTETIPVYFQGKKDFTADVKYSYTIKEGSSGIEEPMGDDASFKIENGELVVTGNASSVRVFDLSGRTLYDGHASQRIQLAHGIYVIQIDGKTYKVVI